MHFLKLSGLGFKTHLVYNGEDVFKFIENTQVDLILLDLIMPKVDGFTANVHGMVHI